jgi:hypothetical protein
VVVAKWGLAQGPDDVAARAEPAMVARLRQRYHDRQPAVSHVGCGGRFYPGVHRIGHRHVASGARVVRELDKVITPRGRPLTIVSDNVARMGNMPPAIYAKLLASDHRILPITGKLRNEIAGPNSNPRSKPILLGSPEIISADALQGAQRPLVADIL